MDKKEIAREEKELEKEERENIELIYTCEDYKNQKTDYFNIISLKKKLTYGS